MTEQQDRIYQEAAALWRELYGETPPEADGQTLLEMITAKLPQARYDRLASPHMRPAVVSYPKGH